ncbi:uncharacterized protein LOC135212677 isoform X2 [Macrobrachium nipponense]
MSGLLGCFTVISLLLHVVSAEKTDPENLKITQVVRVGDLVTRIAVDKPVGPRAEVLIIFVIDEVEYSSTGTRYNDSNYVFECSFSFSLMCCDKSISILFLAKEGDLVLFIGEALLQFKYMDERAVAVVGASEMEKGAFLRVSCGTLKQIEIEGKYCFDYNSPCYIKKSGTGPETKWCTQIENERGSDNETVAQCTFGVAPFKEIPSEFGAAFVLIDSSTLYLTYKLDEPLIEVLAVDPNDGSLLSNNTDHRCKRLNSNFYNCTVNVDIPEHKNSVNFIVVVLTAEGYTESSSTYSYESFQLQVEYLMDGAVYLSWTVEQPGKYDVFVTKGYNFHDVKFHQAVLCENGITGSGMIICHAYFIHLENGDVVAVQRRGSPDVMAVYISFPDNRV